MYAREEGVRRPVQGAASEEGEREEGARGRCRFAVDPCRTALRYLCGRGTDTHRIADVTAADDENDASNDRPQRTSPFGNLAPFEKLAPEKKLGEGTGRTGLPGMPDENYAS